MKIEHAIVLVAGEGKRLRPFTETNPKCFAEVGGKRILKNTLKALASHGCNTVQIVTGHFSELIEQAVTSKYQGMDIRFVVNENYQTTNSMYSLYLGLQDLDKPTWVLEGDVFFEPSILSLPVTHDIAWFVDSATRNLNGAFVETNEQGQAISLQIIRDLHLLKPTQHKSIGILRCSANGVRQLHNWLQEGVQQGKSNLYYDLILGDHLNDLFVEVVDVAGYKWFEIDTLEDLEEARRIFA